MIKAKLRFPRGEMKTILATDPIDKINEELKNHGQRSDTVEIEVR